MEKIYEEEKRLNCLTSAAARVWEWPGVIQNLKNQL